ncbi:anthrone oxygenase family protein [Streptomyces sp. NPDC048172]|uniref:anthrone oxygenase family protein n=1 Tax=Streptomyces sp. NPDC048172 TaxID=3365505 RepID=UPI00372417D3
MTTRLARPDRPARLARLAHLVGLLCGGLFAGFLVAVLVLENSLRSYEASVYTQVRQVELDGLDKLAAATLLPAAAATALLVVLAFRARARTRWFALAALALMAVVLVVTVSVNLPVNGDQLDWSVRTPPADWADARDRWQLAHALRTALAVAAFALLATARVLRSPSAPGGPSAVRRGAAPSRATM